MRVAMPSGTTHGWGIAGNYLSAEIAKLPPIDGVTLHSVAGHHFAPTFVDQWDRINIGYCFFESEIIAYHHIPEATKRWDHIVAGSSWCEHHLRIAGMERTSTILQGIDPEVFFPVAPRNPDGRFIVFSGGKFEFRKGHDLVIVAMSQFMKRHPDVWLACAWHNHWPMSIRTMEQSPLIDFCYQELPCEELYRQLLGRYGIPFERVLLYPVLDNQQMREVYLNSDLGLFPNRCEGGNNMVMCEYMACGRPVLASTMTGHRDVVNADNALCLTRYTPVLAVQDGAPAGVWFESSVDEMVDLLEQAYSGGVVLDRISTAAGKSMLGLSWRDAALKFHALGRQLAKIGPDNGSFSLDSSVLEEQQAADSFAEGRFDNALKYYQVLLQKAPLDPDLHNNLGTVLDRLDRHSEAILHYEKALAIRSEFTEARFNLANTLQRSGSTSAAVQQLETVVRQRPGFLAAWQNLALCRLAQENLAGAVYALEQVLVLNPVCVKSRADLGELLIEQGRYQDALDVFDQVLGIEPDYIEVLNSKGIVLQRLNDLNGAEACYRHILVLEPDNILALNNMGTVMRSLAMPEKAVAFFNQALAIDPDDGKILFNRALAELALGDLNNGWKDYESRFKVGGTVQVRHTSIRRWQGEKVDGERILVWCEQGYGDSIQFVRYVRLLAERGATVVLEVQDERIAPLLRTAEGVTEVVVRGKRKIEATYQIPLLSLPMWFGTLPCPPRYLHPKGDRLIGMEILKQAGPRMKVGLAWAGRPTHEDDRNRSMETEQLEPFAACQDILFVNLQFSPVLHTQKPAMIDLTSQVKTFSDSAALVAQLDLVITVDTAVAHLAGALGVPVWILLPYNPDWRWMLGMSDTVWYASARLFRQNKPFEWSDVITQVVCELKNASSKKTKGSESFYRSI
jgi:tetratricopeptide (TPR) repeat protein/glycosyltransferase involved in cell wall biosynthesis